LRRLRFQRNRRVARIRIKCWLIDFGPRCAGSEPLKASSAEATATPPARPTMLCGLQWLILPAGARVPCSTISSGAVNAILRRLRKRSSTPTWGSERERRSLSGDIRRGRGCPGVARQGSARPARPRGGDSRDLRGSGPPLRPRAGVHPQRREARKSPRGRPRATRVAERLRHRDPVVAARSAASEGVSLARPRQEGLGPGSALCHHSNAGRGHAVLQPP
jgi:hypothetical protein